MNQMTKNNLIATIRDIDNFDDMRDVIDAINEQQRVIDRENSRKFSVGDSVEFEARGRTIYGQVTKINRKTVIVYEAGYGKWKVPASLLSLESIKEVA
jgi:dsDNA-specific endonuclease/ATPase MutS2